MKKTAFASLVVMYAMFLLLPCQGRAEGTFENWAARAGEELQFGITALVAESPENAPWAFVAGYNGAYWFDKDTSVGQTFTVASNRVLQSVSTRVSAGGSTSGEFEIAIYEFDLEEQATTDLVAFVTGSASAYLYDLTSVPVSLFDMSSFNVTLLAGQTYMLTFRGLEDSEGTFYAQATTDIYDGGCVYLGSYVPAGADLSGTWTLKKVAKKTKGKLLVENTGTEPVDDGYAIDVYLSDDGVTPGEFLFSKKVSKRRKRQYKEFGLRFRAPEDSYVIALIDPDDRIAESDEDNNIVVLQSPTAP